MQPYVARKIKSSNRFLLDNFYLPVNFLFIF